MAIRAPKATNTMSPRISQKRREPASIGSGRDARSDTEPQTRTPELAASDRRGRRLNCPGSVGVEVKELESAELEIPLVEILVMAMEHERER